MVQLFDFAISNPPYQRRIGGATFLNIYPAFILFGSKIAEHSSMIHPARAFKGAGRVVQEDVDEIMNNENFNIVEDFDKSFEIFPNTDLKGGVYITEHNSMKAVGKPLNSFQSEELRSILNKVLTHETFRSLSSIIYSYSDNKISQSFRNEYAEQIKDAPNKINLKTNILTTIPQLFDDIDLKMDYLRKFGSDCVLTGDDENTLQQDLLVLCYANGKRQVRKVLNNDFIDRDERWVGKWKTFVSAANGSGQMGERISQPFIGHPNMIATQTYITFGMFDSKDEAVNCAKFLKTRFARALLFTLKTTQQNAKKTWVNIPLLNFKNSTDENNFEQKFSHSTSHLPSIDWDVPLKKIDEQLFDKYGLSNDERSWLLDNIQEQF